VVLTSKTPKSHNNPLSTNYKGSRSDPNQPALAKDSAYQTLHKRVSTGSCKNRKLCFIPGSSACTPKWVLNRETLTSRWCVNLQTSLSLKMSARAHWLRTTDSWLITLWAHLENCSRSLRFQKLTTIPIQFKLKSSFYRHRQRTKMLQSKLMRRHYWNNWARSRFFSFCKTPKSCPFSPTNTKSQAPALSIQRLWTKPSTVTPINPMRV